MERYEYWNHARTRQHFLVRFDQAGQITGVCGPMRQAQIPVENRHNYDYDSQPRHTEWVRQHVSEFSSLMAVAP